MSHERLGALMQDQQTAIAAGGQDRVTHEIIISILRALDQADITQGRALRLLAYQAQRLTEQPTQAALYRRAAADLLQMQREEH